MVLGPTLSAAVEFFFPVSYYSWSVAWMSQEKETQRGKAAEVGRRRKEKTSEGERRSEGKGNNWLLWLSPGFDLAGV